MEYHTIDRDQIVTFKAEIVREKQLSNMTIDAAELEIVIPDGNFLLL